MRRRSVCFGITILLVSTLAIVAADKTRDPKPKPNALDRATMVRLDALVSTDFDHWAKRAKNASGPLTLYEGPLDDPSQIAEYLVRNQQREDEHGARNGAWVADNPKWETFDEGTHGMAIALLTIIWDQKGNLAFHVDGKKRTVAQTLAAAMKCAQRAQFRAGPHWPERVSWSGIPGPWPQSPGWENGEAKFPLIAGLRTYNDGCSSVMLEGLLVFQRLTRERWTRIQDMVLLCGEGTWTIMQRNGGALPEQCGPWGEPRWGRGHEPPALSSRATAQGIEIFLYCHALTNDPIWLTRANTARRWLESVRIDGDVWPHFLEPKTLRHCWGSGDFEVVYHRNRAKWPRSDRNSLEIHPRRAFAKLNKYLRALSDQRQR